MTAPEDWGWSTCDVFGQFVESVLLMTAASGLEAAVIMQARTGRV